MLRNRREKDRARRRTKNTKEKKKSSETEDHKKQCQATLKRLKQGDEKELESKVRLEKVVASKMLRLAVEKRKSRQKQKTTRNNTRPLSKD